MKVEISIKDDREMRNMIKDMIKGQIKSISREELKNLTREVMEENLGKAIPSETAYKGIIRELVRERTRDILSAEGHKILREEFGKFLLRADEAIKAG